MGIQLAFSCGVVFSLTGFYRNRKNSSIVCSSLKWVRPASQFGFSLCKYWPTWKSADVHERPRLSVNRGKGRGFYTPIGAIQWKRKNLWVALYAVCQLRFESQQARLAGCQWAEETLKERCKMFGYIVQVFSICWQLSASSESWECLWRGEGLKCVQVYINMESEWKLKAMVFLGYAGY